MRLQIIVTAFICLTSLTTFAQQGIKGKVLWVTGNQMPGPNRTSSEPAGIKREICIFERTTTNDATQNGAFFSDIKTKAIKRVRSKPDGSFKVKLKPGTYSIFVKEKEGLFANQVDGENCIQCVEVANRKFTELVIRVNYTAAY